MMRRSRVQTIPVFVALFVYAITNALLLLTPLELLDRLLLSAGAALVVSAISARLLPRRRRSLGVPEEPPASEDATG